MAENKNVELPQPSDATSSVAFHPSNPALLATASWDSTCQLFTLTSSTFPSPTTTFTHPNPVLDCSFGSGPAHDGKLYTGALDRGVRELDIKTGLMSVVGTHQEAVRCVHYSSTINAVLTGSWDRSLMLHDPRLPPTPSHTSTIPNLPAKVFAMDSVGDKLVVAMGNRKVSIYDVRQLGEALRTDGAPPSPVQERESSLKFMTRAVKCMPNGEGYASTSIEGRVAVEFFDQSAAAQAKKYAFKCHRQAIDGVDTVFAVNALAFHPEHGTFATGGGDAIVSIWDPTAKKRLRQFPRFPASVSSLAFNADGTKLAVACSVFEEEGTTGNAGKEKGTEPRQAVVIRTVGDDCKPKAK